MKTGTAPILIFATFSIVGFVALPVSAAKSPAMEACSKQWDDMKSAGYAKNIDVSSGRAGAHPGTHEIGFDSAADTITLRHAARSREGFAQGALRAAKWLQGKKGFYEFSEIAFSDRHTADS